MLEFITSALNFLSQPLGEYAYIIATSLFISNVALFFIDFIILLGFKKNKDGGYFLCFSLVSFISAAYFTVQDVTTTKLAFSSYEKAYAFLTVYLSLIFIFYACIKTVKKPKAEVVNKNAPIKDHEECVPLSTAVKYFKKDEIFSGYLDVSYVKQLILELKQKPLTDSDYSEIEELEVYLLKFITRQPDSDERVVLSQKLSMLIKKLALYAS
ncbi:MAG: hypothetical protein J6V66_06935 [Clostridia bacterium]|nr:hypothetical protein [Clostridia bacterium]